MINPGKLIVGIILTCVTAVLLSGCGGGGGGAALAPDTAGPAITVVDWDRPTRSTGGPVTVWADVQDVSGVTAATATITGPTGIVSVIPMTPNSNGDYMAICATSPNSSTSAHTYSVVIRATDKAGNSSTAEPISFQVPGMLKPPPITGI